MKILFAIAVFAGCITFGLWCLRAAFRASPGSSEPPRSGPPV